MKLLVVGLPGSGKGTQVNMLANKFNLTRIQMGDLLRQEANSGSHLGNKVLTIMKSGELVDDETVTEIIKKSVEKIGGDNFIMEGFPRTLEQLRLYDIDFDKVFYLETPREVVVARLKKRNRVDDTDAAIEKRIDVQAKDLETILNHYQDKLVKVDGTRNISEVFDSIVAHLQ